jgi:hypothetical protein
MDHTLHCSPNLVKKLWRNVEHIAKKKDRTTEVKSSMTFVIIMDDSIIAGQEQRA